MWLFTNFGFFSVVQKFGTDYLTVRARVQGDLDNLRAKYLPHLSATQAKGGNDYTWRATVSHADFAAVLGKIAMDLDYANFKNEVAARQGKVRADRYHDVWSTLSGMKE